MALAPIGPSAVAGTVWNGPTGAGSIAKKAVSAAVGAGFSLGGAVCSGNWLLLGHAFSADVDNGYRSSLSGRPTARR